MAQPGRALQGAFLITACWRCRRRNRGLSVEQAEPLSIMAHRGLAAAGGKSFPPKQTPSPPVGAVPSKRGRALCTRAEAPSSALAGRERRCGCSCCWLPGRAPACAGRGERLRAAPLSGSGGWRFAGRVLLRPARPPGPPLPPPRLRPSRPSLPASPPPRPCPRGKRRASLGGLWPPGRRGPAEAAGLPAPPAAHDPRRKRRRRASERGSGSQQREEEPRRRRRRRRRALCRPRGRGEAGAGIAPAACPPACLSGVPAEASSARPARPA